MDSSDEKNVLVDKIVGKIDSLESVINANITLKDSNSRSKIAISFSRAFIWLSAVIIIGVPVYNATIGYNTQIDFPIALTSFGSLFGTSLGFVLGYYFKDKK